MTAILSKDGHLEIPEADDLKPGQYCDIERVGHGEYRVTVEFRLCFYARSGISYFSCLQPFRIFRQNGPTRAAMASMPMP